MGKKNDSRAPCDACPLQSRKGLRPLAEPEIHFMKSFKMGEINISRGAPLLMQGSTTPHLYTVLSGVLIRTRLFEDGRRQILNFMFPGDLVGLQGAMNEPLEHGVEAMTDVTCCVFSRGGMPLLYRDQPSLGFDVTWLASKQEAELDNHLSAVGRRSARERIIYLALFLVQRAKATGVAKADSVSLSITQAQIADMLGLSIIHVNRSIRALRSSRLIEWSQTEIAIPDWSAALDAVGETAYENSPRPFI